MVWYRDLAEDIPPLDSKYGEILKRYHSSAFGYPNNDKFSFYSCRGSNAFGVRSLDASTIPLDDAGEYSKTIEVRCTVWQGNVDEVPWLSSWWSLVPTGSDTPLVIRDDRTGQQWGIWMIDRTWSRVTGKLVAGQVYTITEPTFTAKGRPQMDGEHADMRSYAGNHPYALGSGVIVRPVEESDLVNGITEVMSAYASCVQRGAGAYAKLPASKVEQIGKSGDWTTWNSQSVWNGCHWNWRLTVTQISAHLLKLKSRGYTSDQLGKTEQLIWGMVRYGCTIDATGPRAGIIGGDILSLPRDCLWGLANQAQWVVRQPPQALYNGEYTDMAHWASQLEHVLV